MLSKSQKKLIKSLYQKKYRKQHKMFVVEGKKGIQELLQARWELHALYSTEEKLFEVPAEKFFAVSENELKQISFLTTPQVALAVFYMPDDVMTSGKGLVVALDDVRDPGNLGTIIRLCDWFGVRELVCSEKTVDCFNPKVIQATMGSITRVCIVYSDLQKYLSTCVDRGIPVMGAFMEGDNVYKTELPVNGVLVMGNEANGVSEETEKIIRQKIAIPQFGQGQKTESLNVATATAILLSEFKRGGNI